LGAAEAWAERADEAFLAVPCKRREAAQAPAGHRVRSSALLTEIGGDHSGWPICLR
jgi:hypothetical protein